MRFQKILTLVTLITAALSIVLALLYCSGVMEASMYYTTEYTEEEFGVNPIKADALFRYVQGANNLLVIFSIVFLLGVVLLYIMNCNKRRNYYITNYVAIGIFAAIAVVMAIIWIAVAASTISYAGRIDFTLWKELVDETAFDTNGVEYLANPQHYSESLATPILGIVMALLVLAEVGAWGYNLLWKIKLMKGEKALIENGLNKEVA